MLKNYIHKHNHYMKKVFKLIKKKKELILLFFIFLIGLTLRTYNITNNTQWLSDTGRDILTAKHLSEYPDTKMVSPASSGGVGLKNTPLYYWILTFVWTIYPSEIFVIIVFAFLGTFNIILGYFLSKELFGKKDRLILPLLIALSNRLVEFSRSVWQPHLIPFFLLITFIYLFKGIRDKKYYLLTILVSFLSIYLHYSFLPLLITIIIYIYIDLFLSKQYELCIKSFILTLINVCLFLILTRSNLNKTGIILTNNFRVLANNLFNSLTLLSISFVEYTTNLKTILFYLSFIVPFLLILINRKEKKLLALLLLFISLILTSFYSNKMHFHYINPYYLIVLIIYTLIITAIRTKTQLFSLIFLLTLSTIIFKGNYYNIFYNFNDLKISKLFAEKIIDMSADLKNTKILTCLKNDENNCICPECSSIGIWFYLEKLTKQKLGNIVDNKYENYLPYSNKSIEGDTYLICNYKIDDCFNNIPNNNNYQFPNVINIKEDYILTSLQNK